MREEYTFVCVSSLFRIALPIARQIENDQEALTALVEASRGALDETTDTARCTAEETRELSIRLAAEYRSS